MAAQQSKPQEVTINLKAEVQKLKELRDTISDLKKDGKLANTNENTYKALFNQIEQAIKRMNEAIRDGSIGSKGLQNIQKGIEGITSSITKMVTQEKSTGMGMKEYLKELEKAQNAVDTLKNKIKNFQKQQSELNINEKGNVKKGQEGDVMAAARKASRESRGGKGGDTKAEAMLKTGDLKAIQEQAAAGNKDAQKALELYNAELVRQRDVLADLVSKLDEYKERLNYAKNHLSEIKDTAAFDEGAVAELEKAAQSTEKMGQAIDNTKKKMDEQHESSAKVVDGHRKMETSASKAAKAFIKFNVVIKLAKNLFKEGIEAVVEMDKALTDMSIVTGQSRAELQKMIPDFNALGRATGATSTEMAGLTAEYMKQGRTMKDSMELAEQTAKAAKISGISTAESIEYMTSAINGFNLAAKDAEHVSDVFAKLGAASATDYKDLAIALSKVSAQANTAGMSMEFTTSLLAKGLEVTQEAPESIGTALKTVLARMRELSDYGSTLEDNTSVNKVESALAAVGVELRDTNGQFRDMEEIFNELGPKWDSLNTMQQQAIAQAVAGTRQQSRFLAIMQDWDRTVELSNAALEAEGATMYQHAQYAQSLEFSINKLQTAWQGFISSLTDSDLIRNVFSFVADVVSKFVDFISFLNEHTDGFVGTMATLTGAFALIASLVKQRLEVMKEEAIIRKAQVEDIQKQHAAEQANTEEMRKQVSLKKELSQLEDELKNKKSTAELFKEGGEEFQIKKAQKAHAKDMKQRKKDVKELAKLQDKFNKSGKKDQKTKQKYEEKLKKFKEKEDVRLQKALEKQKAIKEAQEKKEKELLALSQDTTRTAEQRQQAELEYNQQHTERLKTDQNIANIEQQQKDLAAATIETKTSELVIDETDAAVNTVDKEVEEEKTEEVVEQNVVKSAGVVIDETSNKTKQKGLGLSIKQRLEDTKDAIVKAAGAFAEAVKSLGVPAGPIVGAAIVAAIAGIIGVGIAAGVSSAAGSDKTAEKMSENQNKIYENKEKKTNIDSAVSEYEELQKKRVKTDEEIARMEEIEAQLAELDEDRFKGRTGQDLVDAAKAESLRLEEENQKLIKENMKNVKKGAKQTNDFGDRWLFGFDVRSKKEKNSDAVEFLTSDESRLALKQNAQLQVDSWVKSQGFDDAKAREVSQMSQAMYSTISDQDIKDLVEELGADGATKYLEEFALKAAESSSAIFDAANDDTLDSEQAFIAGIEEYNEQLAKAQAEGDEVMVDALTSQYTDYALLADSMEAVTNAMDSGLLTSSISTLASKFNELGFSAEGLSMILNSLTADEYGNISVEEVANWGEDKWSELATANGKNWNEMTDGEKQAFQNQIMDAVKDGAVSGMTRAQVGDVRAGMQSSAENTADIKASLASGEGLTQEQQEYMRDNYAELYGSKEYQEAMRTGNTAALVSMMEEAEAKEREKKAAGMDQMAQNEIDDFERQTGISYEDYLAGNTAGLSDTQLANAQQLAANIQYYKDSAQAVRDFKYEYEGLDELQQTVANNDAIISGLQEKIDKNGGVGTLADYEKMKEAAQNTAKIAEDNFNKTSTKMKDMFGDAYDAVVDIDEETGALTVNMAEYNKLSAAEKEMFDAQLATLQEQNDELQNQKQQLEEINQMQRDAQVEIQNQAIAAMQARLDAEYEATQKSLEKRQELYSKYFDTLEAEEDTANYEADRQALLNKIASLSTATDSESLAKLKEAQEELAALDDEQLQSERDLRREAVEESFEKQGEELDAAYESAMSDVQGMWEEFCTMAGEDQLALFQQYGEGFQEVTDLQKEMAMETLQATMDAIASYGYNTDRSDGEGHKYAEGGLVNYTGPAWVDGTPSKPEAFLDAVDTANIANLAQGLRAMMTGSFGVENSKDNNTVTINELNITVNGGADGQAIGQGAADGFMKAIRELGININKQG